MVSMYYNKNFLQYDEKKTIYIKCIFKKYYIIKEIDFK